MFRRSGLNWNRQIIRPQDENPAIGIAFIPTMPKPTGLLPRVEKAEGIFAGVVGTVGRQYRYASGSCAGKRIQTVEISAALSTNHGLQLISLHCPNASILAGSFAYGTTGFAVSPYAFRAKNNIK